MPSTCNCTKKAPPRRLQETVINSLIKLIFTKSKTCMETPLKRNSLRIEAKKKTPTTTTTTRATKKRKRKKKKKKQYK